MLGEHSNWAANVRAAHGSAVLRQGGSELVRLDEVGPNDRGPILRRYLELAPGSRAHIPVDPHAAAADFERIAARYPVFRVNADDSQAGAGGHEAR
jgi:hypothetical protein